MEKDTNQNQDLNVFTRTASEVVWRLNVGHGFTHEDEKNNINLISCELKAFYQRALQDAESAIIALYAQAGPHANGTHYALAIRQMLEEKAP